MTQNDAQETVELVSSYARRSGGDLTLVVRLPELDQVSEPDVEVLLRGRRGRVRITGTLIREPGRPGSLLRASAPLRTVRPDVYRLSMRPASGGDFRRLQTRLLTSRKVPVALLPGPTPRTRMQPPRPAAAAPSARPPVVRQAATLVDKALSRLPEERAARYRSGLGKVARRVLPGG